MKRLVILIILFAAIIKNSAQVFPIDIADGYTDKLSYNQGEAVTFYLDGFSFGNTDCGLYSYTATGKVATVGGMINLVPQSTAFVSNPEANGYQYNPTTTWTVPSGFQSGYYLLNGQIPFIVKGDKNNVDIVVVLPTNTYYAYDGNNGGSNGDNGLYTAPHYAVSFQRPDNLSDNGHYDQGFLQWLNYSGMLSTYRINFISDFDLDQDYTNIQNAKLIIIIGHSEYWSRQARLNFDQFVNNGGDALILSGNTTWMQVRYNITANNTQLICYRGANWTDGNNNHFTDDPIESTDPLLATYHWDEPSIKYSIMGSNGSDNMRGGYGIDVGGADEGNTTIPCYGGFDGFKVIKPNSPILRGLGYNYGDVIKFANAEYDGTLVKLNPDGTLMLDANNDPILDINALGFYRAEMVGYDEITEKHNVAYGYTDYDNLNNKSVCPLMVFQKTCNSGVVMNVNANEWCDVYNFTNVGEFNGNANCSPSIYAADPNIPNITANMITLMMNDQNNSLKGSSLFSAPPPNPIIDITPAYTNISYNACSTGLIDITPCGVNLTQGYKLDNGFTFVNSSWTDLNNNIFDANIDANCTNYNNGHRPITHLGNNNYSVSSSPSQDSTVILFPNPTTDNFNIAFNYSCKNVMKSIMVFNVLGQEIYNKQTALNSLEISLNGQAKGIYFIKIQFDTESFTFKEVLQ